MRIASRMKEIILNNPIPLNERIENQFYAEIALISILGDFATTNQQDGAITFIEFDTNSNVVSATFEFVIQIPETGEIYNITNGRFDSFFTR